MSSRNHKTAIRQQTRAARIEALETRILMSASPTTMPSLSATPLSYISATAVKAKAAVAGPNASWYTPAQIKKAYGVNTLSQVNGTGQTIAIIVAFDVFDQYQGGDLSKPLPSLQGDLNTFDTQFNLPNTTINVKYQMAGYPPSLPGSNDAIWGTEAALDIEWAHAIAPGATIDLYEANSGSGADLMATVDAARANSAVSVISMSWEFTHKNENGTVSPAEDPNEKSFDYHFTTPAGHQPITFVAGSGDWGLGAAYPSASPNVLAVGGTKLTLNNGGYGSESAWTNSIDSSGQIWGSGGGISGYEAQPSSQQSFIFAFGQRTTPDVSFDGDPSTPVAVFHSAQGGWVTGAGTSLGAPSWAGMMALVNQGRANNHLPSLAHVVQDIYQENSYAFHDITTDSTNTNGYQASTGYDLVTGRGSPYADRLIADLWGVERVTSPIHGPITGVPISNTGAYATAASTGSPSNTTSPVAKLSTVFPATSPTWATPVMPTKTSIAGRKLSLDTLLKNSHDHDIEHLIDSLFDL